jgi:endonuclease YncB( thermonuclease family)
MEHVGIRSLSAVALVLLAAFPAAAQWREPERTLPNQRSFCTVARVIDGDTFQCTDGRRIRVRGVDTPEVGERGHREATRELQRRVEGRTVTVTPHHTNRGRIVGDVTVQGRNVGREMDARGYSKRRGARR